MSPRGVCENESLYFVDCFNYLSIAVMKHCGQATCRRKGLFWAYGAKGIIIYHAYCGEALYQALGPAAGREERFPA